MCLNLKRAIRTIGGSLVAVFSALLGWFFTQSPQDYNFLYLFGIIGLIVIGGALASWE